ncbi:MAG: choice-of-anchor R domain-containing protein [Bdellovibrionia bacterium]
MKPILKVSLASIGMAALGFGAVSCRDLSVDAGRSSLTCAASSVSTVSSAALNVLDPSLGGNELAQSFKPQATVKNVKTVALGLQRVGANLSGNLYVSIVADKNGAPDLTGTVLGTSMLSVSKVTTTAQVVTFTLGAPIAELTAKTTYWIVLNSSTGWSNSAYIAWLGTDTNTYPDGQALAYNGLGWFNPDANNIPDPTNKRDLSFQIGCL